MNVQESKFQPDKNSSNSHQHHASHTNHNHNNNNSKDFSDKNSNNSNSSLINSQNQKSSNSNNSSAGNSKLNKIKERRQQKLLEATIAASKAHNNYILQLVSVNAAIDQYYSSTLNEITDAYLFGFHNSVRFVFKMFNDHQNKLGQRHRNNFEINSENIGDICQVLDKINLIKVNRRAFNPPMTFRRAPLSENTERKILEKQSEGLLELETDCTGFGWV